MRLTLGQLRKLLLREMPLKDVLPVGHHDPYEDEEYDEDNPDPRLAGGEYSYDDLAKDKKAVNKFFKNKKFHDDAVRYYANLPVDVYIVPRYTTEVAGEGRTYVYDDKSAMIAFTEAGGLSKEKAEELVAAAHGGAAVWIIEVGEMRADFLPTPWMIIHAMYDEAARYPGLVQGDAYGELFELCQDINDNVDDSLGIWSEILTMKSARDKNFNSEGDATAEIATQMVVTKGGFRYKQSDDDFVNEKLEEIAALGPQLKAEFLEAVSGKITAIDVFKKPE